MGSISSRLGVIDRLTDRQTDRQRGNFFEGLSADTFALGRKIIFWTGCFGSKLEPLLEQVALFYSSFKHAFATAVLFLPWVCVCAF